MKVCILTGETGSLGNETKRALLSNDYYIISLSRKKVNNAIICDLENINALTLENQINDRLNKLDIIEEIDFVHTAGYYEKETDNLLSNLDILNKSFNVNAFSFYIIVSIIAKICKERKVGGSVVAISTNLTARRNKNTPAYISSKMALVGMCLSFAQTYGGLGLRFNVVSPGMFPSKLNNFTVPDNFKFNTPLGRICEVSEIVDTILFLLSSSAKSITAQNIIIDGGNTNGY